MKFTFLSALLATATIWSAAAQAEKVQEPAPINLSVVPNITYDPDAVAPSKLATHYDNDNLDSEATSPVQLTFELENHDVLVGNGDDLSRTNYAAIIFDDESCQGNIIGRAGNPHLSTKYKGAGPPLVLSPTDDGRPNPPISAAIGGSTKYPRLEIDFWPRLFRNPFYHQDFACEFDDVDSRCGLLQSCVQFQILNDRGHKLNFVDVKVDILFDLLEDCTGKFCGEIAMQRAPVIKESTTINIGDLSCYPCYPEENPPPGTGNLPAISLTQGYDIELCMDIKPDVDGVCIINIESLYLEIARFDETGALLPAKIYPILPTNFAGSILIGPDPNPNYEPFVEGVVNVNDATTRILLPQFELQELEQLDENGVCTNVANPAACTSNARISGTVLLGQGCYCADPTPDSCDETLDPPLPGGRKLQGADGLSMATIKGEIAIVGPRAQVPPTLSLWDMLVDFIMSILSFLTFGLL